MTLPILHDLKNAFPQAQIDWLINKNFQDLLKGQTLLNQILLFQRKEWGGLRFWKNRHTFFQLLQQLQNQKYDLVLDFQGLLRSGFLSFWTRAKNRIGFANAREMAPLFYTQKVAVPSLDVHAFTRYQSLLHALEISTTSPPVFELKLDPVDSAYATKSLEKMSGPFVGIVPQTMWETKIWGTNKLVHLLQILSSHCTPVLFGSKEGASEGEELVRASQGKAINLIGQTSIAQLFACLQRMQVVVTNDSGPMHMAAALKVPVVAIFGPTNPIRTGPFLWAPQKIFHATKQISCAPCYQRHCPTQKECMQAIPAEEVADAVLQYLGGNS